MVTLLRLFLGNVGRRLTEWADEARERYLMAHIEDSWL